jgi:Na+-transporting methylmalonyl-CoA/oxaloacetate decarboxylase gamma subunit
MLDDFREWLSDNLRYILLGLAALLVLLIVIFAVRLVSGGGKKEEKQTEAQTEQKADEAEAETEAAVTLDKNVQEILDVMTKYYNARAEKDVDTLRTIDPDISDEEISNIQNNNPIESYDNITVYSREGLTEGSYVVYIYFDAKIVGIETAAPTLTDKYLETDEEGSLVLVDKTGTQELKEFVEKMRTSDAVQALIKDVNAKLASAEASDEDLQAYLVAQRQNSSTGSDDDDSDEDGSTVDGPEVNSTVTATTTINVRGTASADGVLYGTLMEGSTATVLENLDSGWTKISYTSGSTTIEGYVMTQYLESAE